ncbi:MAG: hypothetical protein HOD00_11650 [Gemmatimonadales bacterium]|jgi:photosystem II stability/assembly factor-like uncharacterized protein|nr:hypothetical protein [Gemmatimonadales bacterium]MBT3773850.1 hypothetical protein [Gemmatimonadales bacterium]MBT3959720.1 hypothetical protein [Gemmatimonadales bacterium]MBT4185657.1 hypothetical protein [Gemmatimonadales bacterium]MBT4438164.1 hypothetical protein [Gemmatimonadales bacterium]
MPGSRLVRLLFVFLAAGSSVPTTVVAQEDTPVVNQSDNVLLRPMVWRSIGPIGQGGRVDDIAVRSDDPFTYYVGFATGGLWKTVNNGTTFEPIFDEYETHSVGALGISMSDPDVLYVGTGESNNRQSSSFGAGMYKTTNGGETFTFVGLRETQSISRVIVHPTDPNTVWVAANGALFSASSERGVFKTTDGGATWDHVLSIDENTGATDLIIKPNDPDHLMAATYQRRRSACCFVGGGEGSGIWASGDAGDTWSRVEGNGLPNGTMGRIALATTPANPDMIYAQIEVAADNERELNDDERSAWQTLIREQNPPDDQQWNGVWRSMDGGQSWQFRSNENGRPMYFSQIRVSPTDPELLYTVDQQVAKSRDGGRTWETLTGFGHVDQHALWINPANHDHIMIGNDGSIDVSYDQGENWESIRTWAVGQPYHASVDMQRPYNVCTGLQDNGTWCGPSSVRAGNILPQDWFNAGGGDGFYTQIDPTNPDIIYSESQNGNVRRINLATGEQTSIRPRGTGGRGGGGPNIVPAPSATDQIRWNWNTPILLSPHNPSTVYVAGNRFFISRDRGDTWTMSEDLSKNIDRDEIDLMGVQNDVPRCAQLNRGIECNLSRNDGVTMWSAGVTVAESPIQPGVLWMGTDDGNIQVSQNGGATWTEVSRNLPGGTTQYYVSRVEASHHDVATAYVSIDGHKSGDLKPYVYVTRDYGQTWQDIKSNLPDFGNVNTIRQDPRNANILYAGTEFGFFISGDDGQEWHRFMNGLPVVRIDDVLVHPRDNDLVLSTHGRSIYVMDDITALQDVTTEILEEEFHLFEPRESVQWKLDRRSNRSVTGDKNWEGENAPVGSAIHYYLEDAASGDVTITITDAVTGEVFRSIEGTGVAGLNRVQWDLRSNPPENGRGGGGGFGRNRGQPATPGVYRVTVSVNGDDYTTTVRVLEDLWMN